MKKSGKASKPTYEQVRALKLIAASALMKANTETGVTWSTTNGVEIKDKVARSLISHGWVVPARDGLSMFEETQTYVSLKP